MKTIEGLFNEYINSDYYKDLRNKDAYDITTYGTEPFKEGCCDPVKDALEEKEIDIENINENELEIIERVFQKHVRHCEESEKAQNYKQTIIDYCKNTDSEEQKTDAGKTIIFRPFGSDFGERYYNHTVCLTFTNEGVVELRDTLSYGRKRAEISSEIEQRIKDTFSCNDNDIIEKDFVESSEIKISGEQKSAQGCFEVCLVAAMLKNNNVEKDTYNNVMGYLVEIIQLRKESLGTKQESIRLEAYDFIEKIQQTLSSKGSLDELLDELLLLEKLKKANKEEALSTKKGNSQEIGF